jgi:membrane protein DedA with SNARE-associated domain/membrane-associated phospholipid phosphatase
MFQSILHRIILLGNWEYLIIFMVLFLETSAFLGVILPGETMVVLAGFLSSQGYLKLGDCIWIIILAAILGDSGGYLIGSTVGKHYFEKHKRLLFLKRKHIRMTNVYFQRHGGKTVFFSRFISILREAAPFAAGIANMPYHKFFFFNAPGGIIWSITFLLIGYYFGQSWQLIEKWLGRAGLFLVLIVLAVVFFFYLYRVISRKKLEITLWFRNLGKAVISVFRITEFIKVHPAIADFFRQRLSAKLYLFLHLLVGLLISAGFVWFFGRIVVNSLRGDPFSYIDQWVQNQILYFQTPLITAIMKIITRFGGGLIILIGSIFSVIYFFLHRKFADLVIYLATIIGGSVLVLVLKNAIHRPRPVVLVPLLHVQGWSFPSGHALMSVIFWGIITYFLIRYQNSWKIRAFFVVALGFLISLISFSRLYLEVHYLSDIIGGIVGGLIWLTFTITGLEVYQRKFTKTGYPVSNDKVIVNQAK